MKDRVDEGSDWALLCGCCCCGDDDDVDVAPEDEDEDGGCCGRACLGVLLCVLCFLALGAVIIWYGPNKLLREMLLVIPRDPGWDWYCGMCIVTCIAIVCLTPIWPPLCMAAGMIFGFSWGTLSNFIAIWSAAMISICIGRSVLKEPVQRCVAKGDWKRTRIMMMVMEDEESSIKFMALFRFLIIPMFLRNYGPSTLEIPLWKLGVAAIPHSLWISILFASLGATFQDTAELIRDGKEADSSSLHWQQMAIFCVAFLVAILLSIYAYMKYAERMEVEEAKEIAKEPPSTSAAASA